MISVPMYTVDPCFSKSTRVLTSKGEPGHICTTADCFAGTNESNDRKVDQDSPGCLTKL